MSEKNEKIKGQEKALIALLQSGNIREAAKVAGLSEKTLYRYMADPEFLAKYRAARRSCVEAAVSEIQALMIEAVAGLRRNLTCGRPIVEIRAARILLDQGFRGLETIDLLSRVERLEDEFSGTQN
jgi:predicted DNA-binding transcriptional regulator AlpA